MWTGLSWCRYWSLLGSATGIDDSFFFVSPVCHYSDCNCEKEGVGWGEGWGWEEKNENRIKWNETVEAAGRTDDCAVANSNPSLTPLPPPTHPHAEWFHMNSKLKAMLTMLRAVNRLNRFSMNRNGYNGENPVGWSLHPESHWKWGGLGGRRWGVSLVWDGRSSPPDAIHQRRRSLYDDASTHV